MAPRTNQLRQRYWTQFNEYLVVSGSGLRTYTPNSKNWLKIRAAPSFRRRGAHLAATALSSEPAIRANFVLEDRESLPVFEQLESERALLEEAVGERLHFERQPGNREVCRIYAEKHADFANTEEWQSQFEWLRRRLERLHQTFHPRVR